MAHTYAAVSEKNNILWHPYTEDLKIPCSNLAITAVPQYPRGIGSRTRLTYQNQVPYTKCTVLACNRAQPPV